eukprot:276265_1
MQQNTAPTAQYRSYRRRLPVAMRRSYVGLGEGSVGPRRCERLPSFEEHQLTRLILSYLKGRGFDESVSTLERESKCLSETPQVFKLRTCIQQGDWSGARNELEEMQFESGEIGKARAMQLLAQRKFIELLQGGKLDVALVCLQQELAPLSTCQKVLHVMAALLTQPMDIDSDVACAKIVTGLGLHESYACMLSSRSATLQALISLLSVEIQPGDASRLSFLIKQGLACQIQLCPYHNVTATKLDLFKDHKCSMGVIPQVQCQILEGHGDEVWSLCFSPDGKLLATASADGSVRLWNIPVEEITVGRGWGHSSVPSVVTQPLHTLKSKQASILSIMAWSPGSDRLLTAGSSCVVLEWCPIKGTLLAEHAQHTDAVTAIEWLPGGLRFVSASLDRSIILWDSQGAVLAIWKGLRVRDMVLTGNGKLIVALCGDNTLRILRIQNGNTHWEKPQLWDAGEEVLSGSVVTSMACSSSSLLLLQMKGGLIVCWDASRHRPISTLSGHRQKKLVLRSCFGGSRENYVASGSEDCKVYIWNRLTADLITSLRGHTGPVNAVAWNPAAPGILASASDDRTARLWVAPEPQV